MKDKIIEAMMDAIRLVDLYGKNDGHEYIDGSRKIAEAAFQAFLQQLSTSGELREFGWENHDIVQDAYDRILDMREEADD